MSWLLTQTNSKPEAVPMKPAQVAILDQKAQGMVLKPSRPLHEDEFKREPNSLVVKKMNITSLPLRPIKKSDFFGAKLYFQPNFSTKGVRYTTKLFWGFSAKISSSAVKYLVQLSGGAAISWATIVGNSSELASFAVLFNEAFVHSIKLHFRPINKHSANSSSSTAAAGSPGDLNTCLATFAYLPHNSTAVSDASNAYLILMEQNVNKVVNLGDNFFLLAVNQTKFDWEGDMGDSATGTCTQGWLSCGLLASKLGGSFQMATPYASGAAVGLGTLLEGGIFGDIVAEAVVSFRNRV